MVTGFTAGSYGSDLPDGIRSLLAETSAANLFTTLQSPEGTNYQVPAGKTFFITKIIWTGTAIGNAVVIGYGDSAVVNSATPPTNPQNVTGSTIGVFKIRVANEVLRENLMIAIPVGKFPFIKSIGGAVSVQIEGIEFPQ